MASLGLWRFINMKQDFDLINYIPKNSYAHTFARTRQQYFGSQGVDTTVYCGESFGKEHVSQWGIE